MEKINQILGFEKFGNDNNLAYKLDTDRDQENRKNNLGYRFVHNQIEMLASLLKVKEKMILDFYTRNASTQGFINQPPNWIVENHFPNQKNFVPLDLNFTNNDD